MQDGVFTRSQARAEGWSDGRQRRLLASGLWIAVTPTVVRNRGIADGPWPRARAVGLSGLVVSHHTAGQLLGLEIGDVGPVLHGTCHGWHRPKVPRAHRAQLAAAETFSVAGLEVTSLRRTIGDILCAQPPEQSIAMATDALRRGLLSVADLSDIAGSLSGRHGVANARAVARSCSERPFSVLSGTSTDSFASWVRVGRSTSRSTTRTVWSGWSTRSTGPAGRLWSSMAAPSTGRPLPERQDAGSTARGHGLRRDPTHLGRRHPQDGEVLKRIATTVSCRTPAA